MTYTLTPQEIEKIRDLVRVLTYTRLEGIGLTPQQEETCIDLAEEIQRFIS